jgi:hypothetical protein
MLGFYANFPRNIHRAETFSALSSYKKLQQALVETLYGLNSENLDLEEVTTPSVPNCKIVVEIGVAEDNGFNYLDTEEKERMLSALKKRPFQVMDFLCVFRYHRMQLERKTRMRFDYYMLRFVFGANHMEIRVFHERGLMYTSPDDIARLVVNKINAAFSKRVLRHFEAA